LAGLQVKVLFLAGGGPAGLGKADGWAPDKKCDTPLASGAAPGRNDHRDPL